LRTENGKSEQNVKISWFREVRNGPQRWCAMLIWYWKAVERLLNFLNIIYLEYLKFNVAFPSHLPIHFCSINIYKQTLVQRTVLPTESRLIPFLESLFHIPVEHVSIKLTLTSGEPSLALGRFPSRPWSVQFLEIPVSVTRYKFYLDNHRRISNTSSRSCKVHCKKVR